MSRWFRNISSNILAAVIGGLVIAAILGSVTFASSKINSVTQAVAENRSDIDSLKRGHTLDMVRLRGEILNAISESEQETRTVLKRCMNQTARGEVCE